MRRASLEMEKIVIWAIGVLLALVIIWFIAQQFLPSSDGGLVNGTIDIIKNPFG